MWSWDNGSQEKFFFFFLREKANSGIEYLLGEKQVHGLLGQFEVSPEVLTTY